MTEGTMTTELTMLVWTAGLTAAMWIPYILKRLATYGVIASLMYRHDHEPLAEWAERAKKAHYNAVENLIPFAALILTAHLMGVSTAVTAIAASVYFWFRAAHYLLYILNVPFTRTITFAVSWFAMAAIFVELVSA